MNLGLKPGNPALFRIRRLPVAVALMLSALAPSPIARAAVGGGESAASAAAATQGESSSRAPEAPEAPPSFNGSASGTNQSSLSLPWTPFRADQLYLNYFATFHGGPLNNPTSSFTVDTRGRPAKPSAFNAINFDSEITAAYMVNESQGIGPDVPFLLAPVARGQFFTLGDVGVKAFDRKAVDYEGLRIYMNVILQAPTSDYSQARGMVFGLKTTPAIRYAVPHSRLTVGAWTEAKEYFGVTAGKMTKLWAGPYVNYRLARNFSLNLEYEMEWDHNVGDRGALGFTTLQTDLQPGFVWNITPAIMINPYLQFFTMNRVSADRAAIGAVMSATVL